MDDELKTNGFRERYPVLEAIARKCEPWGIETAFEEDEDDLEEPILLEMSFPEDMLPDGSPVYITAIHPGPHARFTLDAPFEQYRQFRGVPHLSYTTMWSQSLGAIECALEPCDRQPGSSHIGESYADSVETILDQLGYEADDEVLDPEERVWFKVGNDVTVSIGPASDSFVVKTDSLYRDRRNNYANFDEEPKIHRELTLRVQGVELPDQGRAAELLGRLGNSALFELDRTTGIGLRLDSGTSMVLRSQQSTQDLPDRIVKEYDREPMSLYWYARLADDGMPLLAFLAYYQVLEFYFPQYSRKGALQTLRESLRGLSLDSLRDADLAKVLEVVRTGRKGSFGNEIEQLKATVKQCVDQETLRSFFEESDERKQFYGSDECTRLSPTRIPIGGSSEDWRGDVARRVYEIRNRVVHAKSQHDDLEPLLPFDPEAHLLWHDVELVAFLARMVLSASGRPLRNVASG